MKRGKDNDNRRSNIPENNPSKAMDSKKEVEKSPDEKTDQDFPGYPHYPAREDIMDQRTESHRVDLDVENLPSGHNATGVSQRFITAQEAEGAKNAMAPQPGLGDDNLDVTDSRNEEIGTPQNVSNEDLPNKQNRPGTDLEDTDDKSSARR